MKLSSALGAVAVLLIAALCAALPAGCGDSTPEGAVKKYLAAWQALNWDEFQLSVAPSRRLTGTKADLAESEFKQVGVKFDGVTTETTYDAEDKNRAKVLLTGGTVTYTADVLGKKKTNKADLSKLDPELRTYDTVKEKDVWYVDKSPG